MSLSTFQIKLLILAKFLQEYTPIAVDKSNKYNYLFSITFFMSLQSLVFSIGQGHLKPSFLPPAHATAMPILLKPSFLTSIVCYRECIRCAPHNHDNMGHEQGQGQRCTQLQLCLNRKRKTLIQALIIVTFQQPPMGLFMHSVLFSSHSNIFHLYLLILHM